MVKVQSAIFLAALVAALVRAPAQDTNAPPDSEAAAPGGTTSNATAFVRMVEVGQRAQLQTANVTYTHGDGTEVVLLSAIHIGDAKYYQKLNRLFADRDALLFELVLPDDDTPPGDELIMAGIRSSQQVVQKLLGLSFQIEGIDYDAENFVHADMTMKEFSDAQRDQDESWLKLYFRVLKMEHERMLKDPDTQPGLPLSALLSGRDRTMALKLTMARQLSNMDTDDKIFGEGDNVIVTARNRVALKVLDKEHKAGKKKLGLFYGAAHMPDFERELIRRGFVKDKVEWLSAWNMYIP